MTENDINLCITSLQEKENMLKIRYISFHMVGSKTALENNWLRWSFLRKWKGHCISYAHNCIFCNHLSNIRTVHSYTEHLDNNNKRREEEPCIFNRYSYRSHTCGELSKKHINQAVKLCGWVHYQRMEQFITLRDRYGAIQLVVPHSRDDLKELLKSVPLESVITAKGTVCERPFGQENSAMSTGEIEVVVDELSLINAAQKHLPFNIREYQKAKESLQMKYRYLALRFSQLQRNLELRSKLLMRMREYLCYHCNFIDVETPTLFRRTPGGAQEFVVPTREPGLFYSLVQSPQQLKQLLMVGGLDRYFQVARCYRDEGARPDRQPEFTQLDIEMSFVDVNSVITLVEDLLKYSWPQNYHALSVPFSRITYQEAIERYGTDKPDARFSFEIQDMTQIVKKYPSLFSELVHGNLTAKYLIFPKEMFISKTVLRKYEEKAKKEYPLVKLIALSPASKSEETRHKLFSLDAHTILCQELQLNENILFMAVGPYSDVHALLGHIRLQYCKCLTERGLLQLKPDTFKFLWIYDFPLFTPGDQIGSLESLHHPFTQPHPEDEKLLFVDPCRVRGLHYDLVLNGCEIAGGSVRIHDPQCQVAILELLGIDPNSLQHIIDALHSGCPPHGGIALGIDRMVSLLCNANSLREVIAFPKGFDGKDPMSGSPSSIPEKEMQLYHIKTIM